MTIHLRFHDHFYTCYDIFMYLCKDLHLKPRQNIIEKLQVNNTTEACFKAKRLGLVE